MKLHPRLSRAAVELVIRFETYHALAHPATGGGWTVGYGHTRSAREGVRISRADAEALLLYDLNGAAEMVETSLFAPVTQRQFEALTAFCFNIGAENFRRCSALAYVNAGAELEAADEIERWRRAELGAGAQVVDALVRRRAAEKAHFLGLPEGFSKSPSAVLRPLSSQPDASPTKGGVIAPPVPSSATLNAANSVQARLRALVPEPDAPPPPEPFEVPSFETAGLAPEALLESAHDLEPPAPPFSDPVSPEPADMVPGEDVFVPPPPPAPPAFAPAPFHHEATPRPEAPTTERATLHEEPAKAAIVRARLSPRAAYTLLTAFGACLFVAAAVLILGGKPGLWNLGLGVIGAVVMTPGVYGLLGPQTPPA